MVNIVKDDVQKIVDLLPKEVKQILLNHDLTKLIEIVLDLGRIPEARFSKQKTIMLGERIVTQSFIDDIVARVGEFNDSNRAGLEGTLHRISCIRNKINKIVGLTMRVGRSVFGTVDIIKDCLQESKSLLLLGPPGVGKTTILREIAYKISTEQEQRVVVIDTSNEIGGDGDIPHPAIGRARRMQLPKHLQQHDIMIEAVENHMPEVIIIDEIGTQEEAYAARTIAERGVRLIGTAHGINLENIIQNPTLSDLIGGIESVTLGDDEARKRGTRKTILERASKPTFDICVEIIDRYTVNVHKNTAMSVDSILRGWTVQPELRTRNKDTDEITILEKPYREEPSSQISNFPFSKDGNSLAIYPYAISKSLLKRSLSGHDIELTIANTIDEADMIFALKSYAQPDAQIYEISRKKKIPIKIVEENSLLSIRSTLEDIVNDIPYADDEPWTKLNNY
jgi:stage III sporulation protein AA